MASPTSPQDSPTATKPVPTPTYPVAQQSVDEEAPEFHWTSVPDVDQYRVQIAATEDFETILYDETVEQKTEIQLDSILPTGTTTASWRVRAETSEWTSPWSDVARFARGTEDAEPRDALLVDASPVPLHPTAETSANRNATTFAWESIPEASGYQLQVAHTEDFSEIDVDLTLDLTTSLTLYKALPQDVSPLYWRVRSLFPRSTPGPWSDAVAFEISPVPAPETEPESATEQTAAAPEADPVLAGPAEQSRTTSTMSLTMAVLAVVSFLITILLIALLG